MIDTVLFDLDGTLLPMDQDEFVNTYMGLLAKKMAPQGYDPKHLIAAVWAGTKAMVENDGQKTNEEVFWEDFCHIFGPDARKDEPLFAEFYAADFGQARTVCRLAPEAAETIALLKEKGIRPVLATNPLFPAIATRQRIRWAGLEPEDFELVTTYENSRFCKPNPKYYRDLLDKLGKDPENCLMVGNDVDEDMIPARAVGMEVFLLTDCLLNRSGADISSYPQGGFAELKDFLLEGCKPPGGGGKAILFNAYVKKNEGRFLKTCKMQEKGEAVANATVADAFESRDKKPPKFVYRTIVHDGQPQKPAEKTDFSRLKRHNPFK